MTEIKNDPPDGASGRTKTAGRAEAGSPPMLSLKDIRRAPGALTLSPEIQRLLWAVPLRNRTLVDWLGDIIEHDAWRSKSGPELTPEMLERAGWVADVTRMLVALAPAKDRIDLMTKSMLLLQTEPAFPKHGHLRAMVEFALRLDLARLKLPADDLFATNLAATLDKSPVTLTEVL